MALLLSSSLAGCGCNQVSSSWNSRFSGRRVPFVGSRAIRPESRPNLEVCAGKGKRMMRQGPGMSSRMPQAPPTPPVDPTNAEFVVFVRSKKLPRWVPLSIIKGGTSANLLVKGLDSELSKKMSSDALLKNIGQALYRDKEEVEKTIRKQFPPLKNVQEFEYGFKIRDKERPTKWWVAEDVTLIPSQEELGTNVVENVKDFFDSSFSSLSKSLGSITGTPAKSS